MLRVLGFLALSACVAAQSPLGTISGLVTDPSGAPVPSAQVVLQNEATGVKTTTVSNPAGNYLLPNLAPGRYTLSAEAKGFRKIELTGLAVEAFKTLRQDLKFALETATTQVTVTEAASPVIQTDAPNLSTGLNRDQILELPTNLRSVYNNSGDSGLLAQVMPLTVPGVVQMGAGAYWMAPGAGPNGLRAKVDGIDTTFGNFGSPDPVSQPSMESVEEFTANLVGNRAEFSGLGTITTVTRTGANGLHGNMFWYARNSAFDARNTFVPAKPYQNIHDFGWTFSGPLKVDKTFIFGTYEQLQGVRSYLFTSNVPTVAWRNGDFGSLAVRDPLNNNTPFPGNLIPGGRITPESRRAQDLVYPLPNFGAATLTAGNYRAGFTGPETHLIAEVRLDHNWTSTHSSFLRYQWKDSDYDIPGARGQLPPTTLGTSTNTRAVNFVTIGDVWTASPTLFNEFRAGFVGLESKSSADVKGQDLIDKIGIRGLPPRPGAPGVPVFNTTGLSTFSQTLLNPVVDGHYQVSDNVTWVRGRHTFKFGGEYIYWFVNRHVPSRGGLFGNFVFQNRFSGQPYGDFLLGLPTTVGRIDPWAAQYFRWNDFSFYVQDDWKVSARLTLNYGIRYEYNQPASARDGNLYSFDVASGAAVIATGEARSLVSPYYPAALPVKTAGEVGLNDTLRNADKNNWAPRVGFSFRLDESGKTILRGGSGIYYGHYSVGALSGQTEGPFAVSTTANNAVVNNVPLFTLAQPFAVPGSSGTLNLNGVSPNLRNMYSLQYSLSLEREITRDFGVRLSYIGTKGTQLPYMRNINQPRASSVPFAQARRPYPIYNNVIFAENGANSAYHGAQIGVTKRMSRGLQFSSTYVLAKSLSEVDDTNNAEINTQIENSYDRRRDRANIYSAPRHQWMNNVLYDLPFGKGMILGGWQVNALINFSSGHFLNPQFTGSDPSNTNTVGGRPDVLTAVRYPETLAAWYDRSSFGVPAGGRFGNAGRNTIEGPGYVIFNGGVSKSLKFERAGEVQLGASFQNILNHVNYGQPNMTVNNAAGGVITSTHIFPPAGSARTGMLSLRWSY